MFFPSASPTFSLQTEQQLEESGALQKNRHKSIGRTVCRLRRTGSFGGSTSPPRTEEKCSTRFIQKSSAHKMCPIRISDEEATTAPPESGAKREDRNDSEKTHRGKQRIIRPQPGAKSGNDRNDSAITHRGKQKVPAGISRCRPEPLRQCNLYQISAASRKRSAMEAKRSGVSCSFSRLKSTSRSSFIGIR